MKKYIAILSSTLLFGTSVAAFGWNLEAKYVNALRFERNGAIQFTLFDDVTEGTEIQCDPDVPTVPVEGGGQWFVIKSCNIGKGKGNKSASPSCLSSVERMADMLLQAKLEGIPVHVERDVCVVTETALKPIPAVE
jgi:hypothetical protein